MNSRKNNISSSLPENADLSNKNPPSIPDALLKQLKTPTKPFKSDDEILLDADLGYTYSLAFANKFRNRQCGDLKKWHTLFHNRIRITKKGQLPKLLDKHRLNTLERSIVIALLMTAQRGHASRRKICDGADLQNTLGPLGFNYLSVNRALLAKSRLNKTGLLLISPSDIPAEQPIEISPELSQTILLKKEIETGWKVNTYPQLLDKLDRLFSAIREYTNEIICCGRQQHLNIIRKHKAMSRELDNLHAAIAKHKEWPIATICKLDVDEQIIVLTLLGKELLLSQENDAYYKGRELACAISMERSDVNRNLKVLRSDHTLQKKGYITPCEFSEHDESAYEDENSLATCEFELTPEFIRKLELPQKRNNTVGRKGTVRLNQLVVSEKTHQAIAMIIAQANRSGELLDEWGFGSKFSYGRGITALFYGPPGVGKTAAAEAIAHELDKPLIVADYSQIQSCWVGATEKNIAKIFRQAKRAEVVLFWDEADAMFFDRNSSDRNWEVRAINVLLQEIERFNGICLLATNRQTTLDPALERRISIRVPFEHPNEEMRRRLWKILLPSKMPVAKDVNLNKLADYNLTGAEIKNVLLNTARMMLSRHDHPLATQADFETAIAQDASSRLRQNHRPIGFRT